MVHGFAEQSGGFVWLYSEPGAGSTFKLYLPRIAEAQREPPPTPSLPLQALGGSETVLLVDDDGEVLRGAATMLRRAGYQVLTAHDGEQALSAAEQAASLDLLLTDVVMPRMSGPALARRLRAHRPELPAIFTTGFSARLLDAPLPRRTAVLPKPFDRTQLLSAVRSALDAPRRPGGS